MEQANLKKVNVMKLHEKFQTKKELYDFLLHDVHTYLPKLDSTNVYFFRQIMKGEKEVLLPMSAHMVTVVHQERRHQESSSSSHRWPHCAGFH